MPVEALIGLIELVTITLVSYFGANLLWQAMLETMFKAEELAEKSKANAQDDIPDGD